jgi:hypothetical protein
MRQIDFQSARPPPARALPLKKWDFGTSRLAALFNAHISIHTRKRWRKGSTSTSTRRWWQGRALSIIQARHA